MVNFGKSFLFIDFNKSVDAKKKQQNSLTKEILILYPLRFRPTQTKTKKTKTETKLEFFGFEDKEDQEGEEGSEGGMAGKSSYKIKYFGFDDLSESDSDEESSQAKEKKAKKAAAALAALSSSVDSPHTSDSQDSQASSNTGELILYLWRYGPGLQTDGVPSSWDERSFCMYSMYIWVTITYRWYIINEQLGAKKTESALKLWLNRSRGGAEMTGVS